MDQTMLGASGVANRSGLSRFNRLRGLMRRFRSSSRVMRLIVSASNYRITRIIDRFVAPQLAL
jgi:hypothetical protein